MSDLSRPNIIISTPDPGDSAGRPSNQDAKKPEKRRERECARNRDRRKKKKSKQSHAGSDNALTDGSGIEPASGSSAPVSLPPSAPSSPQPSPSSISLTLPVTTSDTGGSSNAEKERSKARYAEWRKKIRELQKARDLLSFAQADLDEEKIRGLSDEEVLERASRLEGEILEGSDGGRIWLVDLDQREQARTPNKGVYEGKEPDLSDATIKLEGWTLLNRGTIYGYRTIDGRKTLVFAARFSPYANMSNEELEEIRFLAKHFYWLGKLFNPIDTNAAMTGGLMFAEGWRFGYEALFSLGLYKLARNGVGSPKEYAKFLEDMECASAIYARRYKQLAPKEYLRSLEFVEESCVPRFGTLEPETVNETSFGSNLTVTWGEFRNKYHYDNDASPRAAGSWFLTTDDGELVEDPETIRAAVEGGYFALPTFKFAVDFGACPGVVDLMWSSMDDLHATSQSFTAPGFRRIGSSIQVPKRVADAAAKMKDMLVDQKPIAGKEIRMLELELRL
ncbi:hypothetical protein RSAG8_07182, partial [Rhizoctonia solani AG-8 WAC10335]